MTTRTELEACQVTDADRQASARAFDGILSGLSCEHIRLGRYDGDEIVLSFARHRIEAERAAMREAAEIAAGFDDGAPDNLASEAAKVISNAILSRIEVPPSSKSASTPEGERP